MDKIKDAESIDPDEELQVNTPHEDNVPKEKDSQMTASAGSNKSGTRLDSESESRNVRKPPLQCKETTPT